MYSKQDFEKIQKLELSMLKDFDSICRENNIDYFLIGGSAIGAVRHEGFIPWDDDIDLGMSRKDYDTFLNVTKQYSDKYNVVNNDNYHDLPVMNLRWSLKGTKFIPKEFYKLKESKDFEIFLDIFCFENISDDEKKAKKQITKAWFYGKLAILSEIEKPILYFKGFKKVMIRILCYFGHYLLKFFGFNARYFYLKAIRYATQYNDIETTKFAYMFEPKRYMSVLDKNDVYPTRKVKFEDAYINVANNVDKLLTLRYGDYMKIPKESDRHIHVPCVLDFGDYD